MENFDDTCVPTLAMHSEIFPGNILKSNKIFERGRSKLGKRMRMGIGNIDKMANENFHENAISRRRKNILFKHLPSRRRCHKQSIE